VGLTETRVERYGDTHGRGGRRSRQPRAAFVAELPVLVIAAMILAVLVKGFLVQAFYIPSRSMEPTLEVGDRVVVNRLSYRLGAPERGQVVVFLRPTGERVAAPDNALSWVRRAVAQGLGSAPPGNEDLIKRVIAGPGDVVQGSQGRVWLNSSGLIEPYLRPGTRTSDFGPVQVPPGHYWVMGDNREDSSDSRVFGPIPHSTLVGRATGTVWPLPRFGLL
jgi:signal peptidase I